VLIRAAAASAEILARWRDAMPGTLLNFDQLRLSELFFLAHDFGGNYFTLNGVRNKDRFALFPPDTFSAESDILDSHIDHAH